MYTRYKNCNKSNTPQENWFCSGQQLTHLDGSRNTERNVVQTVLHNGHKTFGDIAELK